MFRQSVAALAALLLSACATQIPAPAPAPAPAQPIEVQILAFNDFHGNLESPAPVEVTDADGTKRKIQTGGVAHLAAALTELRQGHPNTVTVSAGDTIGASPLISANYLDEPTIAAMNLLGLQFNSVGNHEFDRGTGELKRMQTGGCTKFTRRTPCAVEPFAGARFRYLAANAVQGDGTTIFPATGIKKFGPITIGFIGMTLKDTGHLVTPSGVKGMSFADEAETANALVPRLKAQGADAVVLLIHQGGRLSQFTAGNDCNGLYGDILKILPRLDPAITTVVSGHTHWAYVCNGTAETGAGRLMTSAGKNGYFVTDLRLRFDPATHKLIRQDAANVVVGNGEHGTDAAEQTLVLRYAAAVAPIASRVIGRLAEKASTDADDGESAAADLIADSMLAATRASGEGAAQIALVNATGVRVPLPAGDVLYKDAFSMMPFGNNLLVMTLTGGQLKAALEQQYAAPLRTGKTKPAALAPSEGFNYAVDMSKPESSRVFDMRLNGKPIRPDAHYRVVVNNYVASGGDGLSAFTQGTGVTDKGIIDLDALVAWIAPGRTPPKPDRIRFVP
ncbi:bifunctional metallophosphatase/5'-nucleotidase [Sphingomonas sp. SM33]|uniref:Bifunctional metallophosphatase/5'-nucleotidase n=1 Tax=Sphingomonas telluris TaxID=2907998 RepID=A0ABS9VJ30_9SPHN|nr:bifunctional metallophosphatase/5'-nucleotidase [Sphingomonas telluris]MCH8614703.1 bifunctional metallophosphatase/5'-nucleotidase [Sphingomonas telluris]